MGLPWELRWGAVRLHTSLLLAAAGAALLLQSPQALLAYALIVAAHLGGHAFLAWRTRTPIVGIQLHALGGSLTLRAPAPLTRTLIGVGGVPGQLLLWLGVLLLAGPLGLDTDSVLYLGLTRINLLVALLNALPISGSDGADLWALPARAEAQYLDDQRQKWTGIIQDDRSRTAIPAPTPAAAPRPGHTDLLRGIQTDLEARDALADAGIPDAIAEEAEALLAELWSPSPSTPRT